MGCNRAVYVEFCNPGSPLGLTRTCADRQDSRQQLSANIKIEEHPSAVIVAWKGCFLSHQTNFFIRKKIFRLDAARYFIFRWKEKPFYDKIIY